MGFKVVGFDIDDHKSGEPAGRISNTSIFRR